jgi:hypothetical protein
MRTAAAAVAALAGLAGPAGGTTPPKPVKPIPPIVLPAPGVATASAAPARAGARPAALTLTLSTELKCGRLGPGVVLVTLPAAVRVPSTLHRSRVRVNGRVPAAVKVTGHVVVLTEPPLKGLTCDVLAPGRLKVVFTRAAAFGNPLEPGRYPIAIRAGAARGIAHLVVS